MTIPGTPGAALAMGRGAAAGAVGRQVLVALALVLCANAALAQTTSSSSSSSSATTAASNSLEYPFGVECTTSQFFDISSLSCKSCPTNQVVSDDGLGCEACDGTRGFSYSFSKGLSTNQSWIPATLSSSQCTCSVSNSSTLLAPAFSNGTSVQRCVVCPSGTSAGLSGGEQACIPNNGTLPGLTPLQQLSRALILLNIGQSVNAATQAAILVPTSSGGDEAVLNVPQSQPLMTLLGPAAYNCLLGQGNDRESCNAVANLCALQLYNPDAASCLMYTALVARLAGVATTTTTTTTTTGTGAITTGDYDDVAPPPPRSSTTAPRATARTNSRPTTGPMPWLFYQGNSYNEDKNVGLQVQFRGGDLESSSASVLTFVLSAYALNGTWLGYYNWTTQFQVCGAPTEDGSKWNKFGWNYVNKCSINLKQLQALLPVSGETVIYEPFLQTGTDTLYPIPVKIVNKDLIEENDDPDSGSVRRFFFTDSMLGNSLQARTGRVAVQYPTSVQMKVVLRQEPRSRIYPPQLTITYQGWQLGSNAAQGLTQKAQFTAQYVNGDELDSRFWYAWQTILIVFLVVLAFPAFMLEMFRFLRKQRDNAGPELLVYAGVCVCDYGSFALALVVWLVSMYYLIVYKLQAEVYFMMLANKDLYNFRVCVVLAIIGQCIGLVYRMWKQINVDVFFLDWEKPKKILAKDGSKEETAPVSAWRTLFVANEWNELQTTRVTYPAFTLIMMVMIMEGANVMSQGAITPDANDFKTYYGVQASIILRFGVTSSFFLVLFLGQYIFKRLIYYPYVSNPITSYIDLLYLANISVFLLEDGGTTGYYIHGRNQATFSDATLRDLNNELIKEEEGLKAGRGLVTSAANPKLADNQIFLVYLTEGMRKAFDSKLLAQVAQQAADVRGRKGAVSTFLKGVGRQKDSLISAQEELTTLFKQVVDDVERNAGEQIIDPTYAQMVLELPPDNATKNGTFVHDYLQAFTRNIFIGNEVRLYMFEALFCCAIDMNIRNFAVSALLTFITSRAIAYLRMGAGEDNLSQKTLVDRHFLI